MNILVLLRMVPDIAKELDVTPDGKALDTQSLRMIVNERDEHALEQALLIKDRHGGCVTVVALEAPEIEDVLWIALARGADRAIRITDADASMNARHTSAVLAHTVTTVTNLFPVDLVLVGCQAIDDLDGQLAPGLARHLEMPYLGLVIKVKTDTEMTNVVAVKELTTGRRGEYELRLPAVLGIQTAERPPRDVPVAKVRAVQQLKQIETLTASTVAAPPSPVIRRMTVSKPVERAEIIEGNPQEVASAVHEILHERGLLPGGA